MSKIESKKALVNATPETVYQFLSDLNNIHELLPLDKISDWKSDAGSCTFKVQGTYTIGLKFQEGTPNSQIVFSSTENYPFPFTLSTLIKDTDGKAEVSQLCDAKINAFLEMMVKGPLKNLFDHMIDKLAARYV